MTTTDRLLTLRLAAERELREDILPYWATRAVDRENGGFFGAVSAQGRPDPIAGKGGVLNARILWTFSAALRRWPEPLYRDPADRAFDYLLEHFWDPDHSGLYWEVDHLGRMLQGRKQTYGQAFGIYALAEYFRATGVPEALDRATRLFEDIEAHAFDPIGGGYWEARGRDWQPIDDIRLSAVDLNAPFSMNTHLHLLEAYTTLALVGADPRPRARLRTLLELVLDRVVDARTGHLVLFFDEHWRPLSQLVSYGHDIETSWLICEAADAVGNRALASRAQAAALKMADAVLATGFDAELGGVYTDMAPDGRVNTDKDWWPQAEAVVGFLNAYRLSGRDEHLEAAIRTWNFIDACVIDHRGGEWYSRVSREGVPVPDLAKVGFWKCPYHDARAMLEIMERTRRLESASSR
ncbi:MAG: AGE family epimerase/isomerase [Candidatus Limnocylindrales bacterium]|jgi:mannobiose 2-epimerase